MWKQLLEKWACKHKWKAHAKTTLYEKEGDQMPIAVKQTLICELCGKIKKIKL